MNRFFLFIFTFLIYSQFFALDPPKRLGLNTIKTGFLIGYQQGTFSAVEVGIERQWKEMKLVKPTTLAMTFTMEYQFKANTIGYKIGPWMKTGRMDFSYGANFTVFSDFTNYRAGVTPGLGIKLLGFHIISGYNIIFGRPSFTDFNRLHLSVRYYISKKRKFEWKKKK